MNRTKYFRLSGVFFAASLALVLSVSGAEGKIISVNLDGEGLGPGDLLAAGESAGVTHASLGNTAATNWNNVTGPFIYNGTQYIGTIFDNTGTATGVTFASRGQSPNGTERIIASGGDAKLMLGTGPRSIIDAPSSPNGGFNKFAQVQFENLSAEFSGGYSAYVYIGTGYDCSHNIGCFFGGWGELIASTEGFLVNSPNPTDPGAVTNNPGPAVPVPSGVITTTPYTTMQGSSAGVPGAYAYDETGAGYVQTTAANPGAGGNYIVLENLTADTLVLTLNPAFISGGNIEWNAATILGVQLVGNAPVPEPSTFVLAGLGLVGLVGFGVRRRGK